MKPLTMEWVEKAEGDLAMVQRELRVRKSPNYDGACFHAQQCAEKYLKARLQEASIPFEKTHNLSALLNEALAVEPLWSSRSTTLAFLNHFAVRFRYPGEWATKEDAKEALRNCKLVRSDVRKSLGLPE